MAPEAGPFESYIYSKNRYEVSGHSEAWRHSEPPGSSILFDSLAKTQGSAHRSAQNHIAHLTEASAAQGLLRACVLAAQGLAKTRASAHQSARVSNILLDILAKTQGSAHQSARVHLTGVQLHGGAVTECSVPQVSVSINSVHIMHGFDLV